MGESRDDISGSDETYVIVDEEPGGERGKKPEAVRAEEASVSPLDRGFLYGDAVFETLRCYGNSPAFLDRHTDRLNSALDELGIPVSFTEDDLETRIRSLLEKLHADSETDAYVRISVTRGEREGLLTPTETSPTLFGVAKSIDGTRRYEPADVEVVEETRPDGKLGRLKTHNYLPNILAKSEVDPETDEALMLDRSGCVASGAVSNVFFFDSDGVLVTPETSIRKGVTREVVLEIAESLGIDVREKNPRRDVVDECVSGFLTNTTWGVRRISSIDGHRLEDTGTVEKLEDEYIERASSCESVFDSDN